MSSPCDGCAAPCCHEAHVLPSGHEALRIAASLPLPLAEFTQLRPRDQLEADFRILLFDAETGTRRYHRLELRKVPTPNGSHAQRCYFLQSHDDGARCGCYLVRPRACRAFPYQEAGDGVKLARLSKAWCPKGAWSGDPVDVAAHHQLRREQERERAIFHRIIDTWNARFTDENSRFEATQFLAYLQEAYAALDASV